MPDLLLIVDNSEIKYKNDKQFVIPCPAKAADRFFSPIAAPFECDGAANFFADAEQVFEKTCKCEL